jgi:O-antigen/teichoic acid export membrane protein
VFQGLEKMKWVAACSVIRQMVFAGGVFIIVLNTKRIWVVALVEILAVITLVLYCIYMLIFHVKAANFKTDTRKLLLTFKEALPIGLSDITWAFMWYFATVLLGLLTTGNEVGWFSAAHRPVMTLHTFVWLYFCNLLPTISRSVNEQKEVLDSLMRYSMSFLAWGTIFLGTVGLTMAEPLIVLVFGDQFRESAGVMKVLIWMIPLSSLGCHYRYILIGYEHQKYEFIAHALAAIVSIVMGFVLIPIYAEKGAAFSLISAVTVYCLFVYVFVKMFVHQVPFLPYVFKPLLTGAAMVGLFFAISTYKLWIAICVCIIFYILTMMILQPEIRKIPAIIFSKQDKM